MSTSITTSFVRQYERDVHHAFQKRGAILRPAVRTKDGVVGSSTTFQKIGTGTATTKSRHGLVTPMNQSHTAIQCTISDFYAGDYVDKLDEAKIVHDERMAIAQGGAWALGRKVDDQIFTIMDDTTQSSVSLTVTNFGTVQSSLLALIQALNSNDVPNDGQRYAALTPFAWSCAMTVESFASADYVGPTGLPFTEGAPMHSWKSWMGVMWTVHTGCPGEGTASAKGFAWHKTAVGYATGAHAGNVASNQAVAADIWWHGQRVAHFVNHMMSGGACLIDDPGVIEFSIDDTGTIPTAAA